MNSQSQMLSQKLMEMNTALASLGAAGINFPPLQGEQLKKDADGLPMAPNNMMSLIGQYVNPPLPNLMGGNNSNTMMGLSNATNQIDNAAMRLGQSLSQVRGMEQSCTMQAGRAMLDIASQQAMQASNCHNTDYCAPDRITALNNSIAGITGRGGITGPSVAALYSGIQTACDPTSTGQMPGMRELLLKKAGSSNAAEAADAMAQLREMAQYQPRGCAAFYASTLNATKALQSLGGPGGYNPSAGAARTGPGF
jgi:hypothetical protein